MNHITGLEDIQLPDLIILDYNIPEINGSEILEQLKKDERYSSIPKIVWSTSDLQQYRDECARRGARLYVKKPNTFLQVVEMARNLLSLSA